MPRTKSKPAVATLIVELPPDLRQKLERLAKRDAGPDEQPNMSRTVRRLIREEDARQPKS